MSSRRAALVAGGSSGIGLEIARGLLAEDHDVTIGGRRPERLERALEELGAGVHPVRADLSDEAAVRAAVAAHADRFGRLDTLVNSAGYGGPRAALEDVEVEKIDRILAVDLRGTMLLTRACLSLLGSAGAGHGKALVVNVTSVAARLGVDSIAAYSAAKGGVAAFGRALAVDLAWSGVQVTTLLPGYVDTPM